MIVCEVSGDSEPQGGRTKTLPHEVKRQSNHDSVSAPSQRRQSRFQGRNFDEKCFQVGKTWPWVDSGTQSKNMQTFEMRSKEERAINIDSIDVLGYELADLFGKFATNKFSVFLS